MYSTTPRPSKEQKEHMEKMGFSMGKSTSHQSNVPWIVTGLTDLMGEYIQITVDLFASEIPSNKSLFEKIALQAYKMGRDNKIKQIKKVLNIYNNS